MRKIIIKALWCGLIMSLLTVGAFAQEVLLGGQVVGIHVGMKGVLVAGLSPVENGESNASPAELAGLEQGDMITQVEGKPIENAAQLIRCCSYHAFSIC